MKSYFQSEKYIIPFREVASVYKNEEYSRISISVSDALEGISINNQDADRFLAEYTAWLDAQEA